MILYIYIALFFLASVATLRHDAQMFQQNSYRYSRYFKWLMKSRSLVRIYIASITLGGYLLFVTKENSNGYMILLILSFALFSWWEFSKKFKVKIAYTDRVKRLLFTSLLISTLIFGFAYLKFDSILFVALSSCVIIFSNIILLLANLVNAPLESVINRWYINDARKIIATHKDLIIIGVTGSYGKTTTKNYLYRMLTEKYNVLVTPGNYNTLLGVVRTIREQLRPQHQIFIVEMGAKQRGDIKEICDLVHPKIGIVTSVGEAHLETFKSVENIQKTKFELIDSIPADGFGVVNFDSQNIKSHKYEASCPISSYSIEETNADYKATRVAYDSKGVSFTLNIGAQKVQFSSSLLGSGNILNLVAGIIVASALDVSPNLLQRAIKQLQPVEHRLSISRAGGLTILDDAYNSNPTGAKMALDVLREFSRPEGAKRVVITPGFVEMGANQTSANYLLGCQIASSADYVVVVNKHNREAIVKGLNDSSFGADKYFVADSLDQARRHLARRLSLGDVVLYENDLPDSFK